MYGTISKTRILMNETRYVRYKKGLWFWLSNSPTASRRRNYSNFKEKLPASEERSHITYFRPWAIENAVVKSKVVRLIRHKKKLELTSARNRNESKSRRAVRGLHFASRITLEMVLCKYHKSVYFSCALVNSATLDIFSNLDYGGYQEHKVLQPISRVNTVYR